MERNVDGGTWHDSDIDDAENRGDRRDGTFDYRANDLRDKRTARTKRENIYRIVRRVCLDRYTFSFPFAVNTGWGLYDFSSSD